MVDYNSLRVWWIPQIPGKPFYVYVESLEQAGLLLDVLAEYDEFHNSFGYGNNTPEQFIEWLNKEKVWVGTVF